MTPDEIRKSIDNLAANYDPRIKKNFRVHVAFVQERYENSHFVGVFSTPAKAMKAATEKRAELYNNDAKLMKRAEIYVIVAAINKIQGN